MENTDINKIKKVAISFLLLPVQEDDVLPPELVLFHPFIQSSIIYVKEDGDSELPTT